MAMKTIRVEEASGQVLDYLVAKCKGHDVVILTVQEQRDRWLDDVPAETLEKEARIYDQLMAPEAKPEIRIAADDGYKRTPYHSEASMLFNEGLARFQYSTSNAQGMPILDDAKISTLYRLGCWWATAGDPTDEESMGLEGDTRLVAGLRTWVWGQLGDTAEVPEELLV